MDGEDYGLRYKTVETLFSTNPQGHFEWSDLKHAVENGLFLTVFQTIKFISENQAIDDLKDFKEMNIPPIK